jgi:hypothetical protein
MLINLLPTVNVKVLQMVYFAHFYSQISYGIIFWGSSTPMRYVFIIQKQQLGLYYHIIRVQGVLAERVSESWIYLQFLVYMRESQMKTFKVQ